MGPEPADAGFLHDDPPGGPEHDPGGAVRRRLRRPADRGAPVPATAEPDLRRADPEHPAARLHLHLLLLRQQPDHAGPRGGGVRARRFARHPAVPRTGVRACRPHPERDLRRPLPRHVPGRLHDGDRARRDPVHPEDPDGSRPQHRALPLGAVAAGDPPPSAPARDSAPRRPVHHPRQGLLDPLAHLDQELTFLAMETAVSTTRVFEVWITVAGLYFCLCYLLSLAFARLEKTAAVART